MVHPISSSIPSSEEKSADRVSSRPSSPVPVFRAADSAVNGSGKARLHPTDPFVLLGTGTRFTSQVKPKSTIQYGKGVGFASAEVEEVKSDGEIKSVPSLETFPPLTDARCFLVGSSESSPSRQAMAMPRRTELLEFELLSPLSVPTEVSPSRFYLASIRRPCTARSMLV